VALIVALSLNIMAPVASKFEIKYEIDTPCMVFKVQESTLVANSSVPHTHFDKTPLEQDLLAQLLAEHMLFEALIIRREQAGEAQGANRVHRRDDR
jgi:hypothetical protein